MFPATACDSAPCLNGGVCELELDGYICQCQQGFTGTNCQCKFVTFITNKSNWKYSFAWIIQVKIGS